MHIGVCRPNGFSRMFSWAFPSEASTPDSLLHFPKVTGEFEPRISHFLARVTDSQELQRVYL